MKNNNRLTYLNRATDLMVESFHDLILSADELARDHLPEEGLSPRVRYLLTDLVAELRDELLRRGIDPDEQVGDDTRPQLVIGDPPEDWDDDLDTAELYPPEDVNLDDLWDHWGDDDQEAAAGS